MSEIFRAEPELRIELRTGEGARPPRSGHRRVSKALALLVSISFLVGAAAPAFADEYEPSDAGHPLRVVAYVLHPVGVILDYLLFRPAHWLFSHEPLRTLVGHEDE